jgi:hypothetical protein
MTYWLGSIILRATVKAMFSNQPTFGLAQLFQSTRRTESSSFAIEPR